jgi:hypothetical protein
VAVGVKVRLGMGVLVGVRASVKVEVIEGVLEIAGVFVTVGVKVEEIVVTGVPVWVGDREAVKVAIDVRVGVDV